MCGIIGYIGDKKALPFLLTGLKSLEYRGYDSCGLAMVEKGELRLLKAKGEVDGLVKKTREWETIAQLGVGHTRWATHGEPSVKNAHPHVDCQKKIAVVHNGIIENFLELKKELESKGHVFTSETDTEVLPHLIEDELKGEEDFLQAVARALKKVVGAYGILAISVDFPDQIIAARQSSPLVLGLGKRENFIASDQPALLGWTKDLAVLKDGQLARITAEKVEIISADGQADAYHRLALEGEVAEVSKGAYEHFMLKEIFEQPLVMQDGLRGRFSKNGVKLGGLEGQLSTLAAVDCLALVACGSSYYASVAGGEFFKTLAGLPVLPMDATELVGSDYPWRENQPVVFVSQSGETADILVSLRQAVGKKIVPLGLTNVVGSSLARETTGGVYARAGFEIGVAATKTFSATMLVFLLWALAIGAEKKVFRWRDQATKKLLEGIQNLPLLISKTLEDAAEIKGLAESLKKADRLYFFGRGLGYAAALEGALKVKEIAYIPSEAMPAGELKHGPLALVDNKSVLVFLIPDDSRFKKNVNSVQEAVARGGRVLIVTNKKSEILAKIKANIFYYPKCHPMLSVFPQVVWLQLLAYYLGLSLGRPIDKPRNLAKSVTVE